MAEPCQIIPLDVDALRNPKGAGRKAHEPTDVLKHLVETAAGFGIPHVDIAKALKISRATLDKFYPEELEAGHIFANMQVVNALFTKAMSGDVAACIWWTKARMGWKEKKEIEHSHTGDNERDVVAEFSRRITSVAARLAEGQTVIDIDADGNESMPGELVASSETEAETT